MRLSFIAAALASAIALCEGSSKMVIGYFPNWLYANYPVETIPFDKYTHINYAFAILNNEDNLPSFTDDWAVESSLPKIVDMAHAHNSKVLLSVGGWTGSKRFSPMVATQESRKKFIDWNLEFISKYNTDGVDLDWEYPGKQAAGCNEFADNDADNFLLLLKELREALDAKYPQEHKEISMAVHVQPFIKSGVPMTDVADYVSYFDHINLMTYDMNGAWASTTGPNAPFQVEEGKGAPFSFVKSIRDWKAAGVPGNKITAGLAFYGRTMKAQEDMTVQRDQFQSSEIGAPKGDSDDAYWDDPYCNVDTGGFSGIWKWTNLRKEGILGSDFVTPGVGWERNWDNVTQTPWLFNPSTKNFITYDDPQSLNIKVEHALCEDLAGVMVWDIHQDNGELVDVVNRIHNPAPESCENVVTVKVDQLADNTQAEELDDLGNVVVPPTTSVEIKEITEETNIPEFDDFDDDDWEDEDGEWEEGESSVPVETTSDIVYSASSVEESDTLSSESVYPVETSDTLYTTSTTSETTSTEDLSSQTCSSNGQQKCANAGKSGSWLTCNFDKWLVRDCAPGLVCKENQGGVYCDFAAESVEEKTEESVLNPNSVDSSQNRVVEPVYEFEAFQDPAMNNIEEPAIDAFGNSIMENFEASFVQHSASVENVLLEDSQSISSMEFPPHVSLSSEQEPTNSRAINLLRSHRLFKSGRRLSYSQAHNQILSPSPTASDSLSFLPTGNVYPPFVDGLFSRALSSSSLPSAISDSVVENTASFEPSGAPF